MVGGVLHQEQVVSLARDAGELDALRNGRGVRRADDGVQMDPAAVASGTNSNWRPLVEKC